MSEAAVVASLKLLGIEEKLSRDKLTHNFDLNDPKSIRNPSADQLQLLMHFLLHKLNPIQCENRFRSIYPRPTSQPQQIEFRNAVDAWMKQLKENDADFSRFVNTFSRGTLMRSNEPKFVQFLTQLSNFVLFRWLQQLDPTVTAEEVNKIEFDDEVFNPPDSSELEDFELKADRVESRFKETLAQLELELEEKRSKLSQLMDASRMQLSLDLDANQPWEQQYKTLLDGFSKRRDELNQLRIQFNLLRTSHADCFRFDLSATELRSKPLADPITSGWLDKWSESDKALVISDEGKFSFERFVELMCDKLDKFDTVSNEEGFQRKLEALESAVSQLQILNGNIEQFEKELSHKSEQMSKQMPSAINSTDHNTSLIGDPLPKVQLYRPHLPTFPETVPMPTPAIDVSNTTQSDPTWSPGVMSVSELSDFNDSG